MKFQYMILIGVFSFSIQSLADASRIDCKDTSYTYRGYPTSFVRIPDGPDGEMGFESDHTYAPVYFRGSGWGLDTFCTQPNSTHGCPLWLKFRTGFARGGVGDEQTDVEMGRIQDTRSSILHCKIVDGDKFNTPSSQISDVLPEGTQCASRKRLPTPRDYAIFAKLQGAVGMRESVLPNDSLLGELSGDGIEPRFGEALKREIDQMATIGFKPIYVRDKQYRDFIFLDFYYNNSGFIPQTGASGAGSSGTEYISLDNQLPYYFSNSDGALVFKKPVGSVNTRCMK